MEMEMTLIVLLGLLVVSVGLLSCLRICKEYERCVVFRLGKLHVVRGPGLFLLVPAVDIMFRIDIRTITLDVPPQDIITRDNVPVKVNAVVYFMVSDPKRAVIQVANYYLATSQIAQTTLRNILGQSELDELLSQRETISRKLQEVIDKQTDPWGIKVSLVEVKDVELPESMQRAMARQAEAERERRAKIIHAEGELQASEKLSAAAEILGRNDASIQLRFLQTLTEISAEKNSTIIFPVPVDVIGKFIDVCRSRKTGHGPEPDGADSRNPR
jgi:regulator of protease activity HflC (stomatin/prohibitin superfamily)